MDVNNQLPEEIKNRIVEENIPAFRSKQIFNWIHRQLVTDFSLMTNISKNDREKLAKIYDFYKIKVKRVELSRDNTKKYLLMLKDQALIEAAVMFDRGVRKTICVSSQVGCSQDCLICATGRMGFTRNLTSTEIITQIELLYKENDGFENIVFMGMGEPLQNLANVLKSIEVINHPAGLNIGARKITISTAGIPHKIIELAKFPKQVRLAVSINSAIDKKRSRIMPINKKYNLQKLSAAISKYNEITNRRVTLEYVMINDFNDLEEDLLALLEFCQGLKVNVNLIPLNKTATPNLRPTEEKVQTWFLEQLVKNKINATLRRSKGDDIRAACGQLAGSVLEPEAKSLGSKNVGNCGF